MFDLSMLPTEQRLNPYPLYAMMRAASPVLYLQPFDLSIVFRYDDVKAVLTDYATFSSDFSHGLPHGQMHADNVNQSIIGLDPPLHTNLRSLVTRAFTHKAIARLEPRIAELTHQMIDSVAQSRRIDLIQDLAYPLPVIVIAEMLGVPAADRAQFKVWSDALVASADAVFTEASDHVMVDEIDGHMQRPMNAYLRKIIAQRHQQPADDLISDLIAAEIDGQHLSEPELVAFCALLLIAGNVTTTNLIGNAMRCFLEYPDQLAEVKSDYSLIPSALEETLRYLSPVQAMFRFAIRETELSGEAIHPGRRMLAMIGSANRDPEKFADPERFDVRRAPNPHIAFGHGIHFCLGAPLARLEARVALPIILQRLPNFARVNDDLLEPSPGFILNGVRSLPLKFDL